MRCSSQKRCWVSAGMSWVPSHLEGGREGGWVRTEVYTMRFSSQKRCWVSAGMSWVVSSHLERGREGGREG